MAYYLVRARLRDELVGELPEGGVRTLLAHLIGCPTGRTPADLDALAVSLPDLNLTVAHDGLAVDV